MIFGKTEKIKKVDLLYLEELKGEKFFEFADIEFIKKVTPICQKYKIDIGFTLNKDKIVDYIFVNSDYKDLPIEDKSAVETPTGRIFNVVFWRRNKNQLNRTKISTQKTF